MTSPIECDLCLTVVNYRSSDHLVRLLASVPEALGSLTAEVIVVDSASGERLPREEIRRAGARLIMLGTNRGYAHAVNAGLAVASSPIFVLANADVTFVANSLQQLVAPLRGGDPPGMVAPARVRTGRGERDGFPARGEPRILDDLMEAWGIHRLWPGNPVRRAHWHPIPRPGSGYPSLAGPVLASRTEILRRLGGLDESYFLYYEEIDISVRLKECNFRLELSEGAIVDHVGSGSGADASWLSPLEHRSRWRFARRREGALGALAWVGARSLASPFRLGVAQLLTRVRGNEADHARRDRVFHEEGAWWRFLQSSASSLK